MGLFRAAILQSDPMVCRHRAELAKTHRAMAWRHLKQQSSCRLHCIPLQDRCHLAKLWHVCRTSLSLSSWTLRMICWAMHHTLLRGFLWRKVRSIVLVRPIKSSHSTYAFDQYYSQRSYTPFVLQSPRPLYQPIFRPVAHHYHEE